MMLEVRAVTPFYKNGFVVACERTREAVIIDPGDEADQLVAAVRDYDVDVRMILLTHAHVDHITGVAAVKNEYSAPVYLHRDDLFLIEGLPESGRRYSFPAYAPFVPHRWLEGGDTVALGNLTFDVVHCPGHTPGHVVFVHRPSKVAFVGDVLFRGSIGRTDFPRGNHEQLMESIRKRLWPLGVATAPLPFHTLDEVQLATAIAAACQPVMQQRAAALGVLARAEDGVRTALSWIEQVTTTTT